MFHSAQVVIVVVVVLGAAVFLGRRIWRRLTQADAATGCGTGCDSCPQSTESTGKKNVDLISLDTLTSSADRLPPPRT